MKRPTISLLAVVFSTACGVPGPGEEQHPPTSQPRQDQQQQQQQGPSDLEKLNQELSQLWDLSQLTDAQRAHFRPLCDANGYPLVGNIHGKANITASEFCSSVRK